MKNKVSIEQLKFNFDNKISNDRQNWKCYFCKKILFNSSEVYMFNQNKELYKFDNRKECCLLCFNEKNKNNERYKYVKLNEKAN